MEVLFYVLANAFFLVAGIMLCLEKRRCKPTKWGEETEVMVARDTQIMFFIGTVIRFYWSASPPAVWSNEGEIVKFLCQTDIVVSPIVWGVVLFYVALRQQKYTESIPLKLCSLASKPKSAASDPSSWAEPTIMEKAESRNFDNVDLLSTPAASADIGFDCDMKKGTAKALSGSVPITAPTSKKLKLTVNRFWLSLNWATLTSGTLLVAYVLHYFNPPTPGYEYEHEQPWPMADVSVVWNMLLDCVAMLPQLYVIYKAPEPPSDGAANFVGMLCIARAFRMVAWGHIIFTAWYRSIGVPGFLWCYVLPDTFHTVLMSNYLYLFLRKLKNHAMDAWTAGEMV